MIRKFSPSLGLLIIIVYISSVVAARVQRVPAMRLERYTNLGKRANTELTVSATFVLKHRNEDHLEAEVLNVAMPNSEHYGNYWSAEQVKSYTTNYDGIALLDSFLALHDMSVSERMGDGHYVTVSATLLVWETILHTKFYQYHLNDDIDKSSHVHTEEYTIPAILEDHVSYIDHLFHPMEFTERYTNPTVVYDRVVDAVVQELPKHHDPLNPSRHLTAGNCATSKTKPIYCMKPTMIKSMYGIPQAVSASEQDNSQMIFATLHQNYSPSDLNLFLKYLEGEPNVKMTYDGPTSPAPAPYNQDITCKNKQTSCQEANLDVQYIQVAGYGVQSIFSWVDSGVTFSQWLSQFGTQKSAPSIISISYGVAEPEIHPSEAQAFSTEAQKLALRGTTIFVSSGDNGAPGPIAKKYNTCENGYIPQFPASCPYVVAVGATMGPEAGKPEVVCSTRDGESGITSGGGFSSLYVQPTWQKDAVDQYFQTVKPIPAKGYKRNGRAYPDMSTVGNSFEVVLGGRGALLSGTSASAPTLAGIFSLINTKRREAGKPTLGLLTPALYANAGSSTKWAKPITSGDNCCTEPKGESVPLCCPEVGFNAGPDWDPVTGFGSPKYEGLLSYFLSIAPKPTPPVSANIVFHANQTINGVQFDKYTTASYACDDIIKHAIIQTINLPDVDISVVRDLKVEELTDTSLELRYTLSISYKTKTAVEVEKEYTDAVKDGQFTEWLRSQSKTVGGIVFEIMGTGFSSEVNTELTKNLPSDNLIVSEALETYSGISPISVIAITILSLGSVLIIYFFCSEKSKVPSAPTVRPRLQVPDENIHDSARASNSCMKDSPFRVSSSGRASLVARSMISISQNIPAIKQTRNPLMKPEVDNL